MNRLVSTTLVVFATALALATACDAAREALPDSPEIMKALADELESSMALQLEDLEKPYFIQCNASDTIVYQINASLGAVTSANRFRSRNLFAIVRVGDFTLDNTNFVGGRSDREARIRLPLDNDYDAIRHAVWLATDARYKAAVETLTKKRAYLGDKNMEDRPNDFTSAEPIKHIGPISVIEFDAPMWERRLETITSRFKQHPIIKYSGARLTVDAGNDYIVNSDGTRIRMPDSAAVLMISAHVQADDGARYSDGLSYAVRSSGDLPSDVEIHADIDELVARLTRLTKAPLLDGYIGPILFDASASSHVFTRLLAVGVVGRPSPIGNQRDRQTGYGSLESKLGRRILPRSFSVYDDPAIARFDDTELFGHYEFDDEGIPPQRVNIIEEGVLKNMVLGRTPMKKLSGSNGHARRAGWRAPAAAIGCLFIEDENAIDDEELKEKLIQAAIDEGLEFAIRVSSVSRSGSSSLRDPLYVYKVYVEDGREELVRGAEFGPVSPRNLRNILASGTTREVTNTLRSPRGARYAPTFSIVSPAILFEELELRKIEQEHDTLPILEPPLTRE